MTAPAPVAALMDAIAAAINSDAAQELLGDVPARRAYQETQDLRSKEAAAIFISPNQWRTLGRCGALALEQHLLNVVIARRDLTGTNTDVDAVQVLADQLRGLLQDLETDAGRVVDIMGPQTIDAGRLQTGMSAISLLLDCDVLLIPSPATSTGTPTSTGTAAAEPDGMLTIARQAVWDAIEAWEPLAGLERLYKTDLDVAELQLRDPAPHELPALALYWGSISPEWKWNRAQEWPLSLRASLWLPGDEHTAGERYVEQLFDAFYQAKPENSSVPYIQAATGYPPRRVSDMTVQSVTLGRAQQLRALRVDIAFALRSNKDPFGNE